MWLNDYRSCAQVGEFAILSPTVEFLSIIFASVWWHSSGHFLLDCSVIGDWIVQWLESSVVTIKSKNSLLSPNNFIFAYFNCIGFSFDPTHAIRILISIGDL